MTSDVLLNLGCYQGHCQTQHSPPVAANLICYSLTSYSTVWTLVDCFLSLADVLLCLCPDKAVKYQDLKISTLDVLPETEIQGVY